MEHARLLRHSDRRVERYQSQPVTNIKHLSQYLNRYYSKNLLFKLVYVLLKTFPLLRPHHFLESLNKGKFGVEVTCGILDIEANVKTDGQLTD